MSGYLGDPKAFEAYAKMMQGGLGRTWLATCKAAAQRRSRRAPSNEQPVPGVNRARRRAEAARARQA